jgi:hypothetical protein
LGKVHRQQRLPDSTITGEQRLLSAWYPMVPQPQHLSGRHRVQPYDDRGVGLSRLHCLIHTEASMPCGRVVRLSSPAVLLVSLVNIECSLDS